MTTSWLPTCSRSFANRSSSSSAVWVYIDIWYDTSSGRRWIIDW